MNIIITSPSLNPQENVSGISSVTNFIISNNKDANYIHFELGRKDNERGGWHRIGALVNRYAAWKKLIKTHKEAIIHYNFPLSKASLLRDPWFMRYALKHGRRMVVHVHGGLFLTAKNIPWLLKNIMKWTFRQNVPFIVLSDMEKDIVVNKFGAKNVSVLPNCVDLSDAEEFAEANLPHNENRPLRIGYIGRIEPNKGMSELLEACVQLKKDNVPFMLVFAGKEQTVDEYLPKYKHNLGDNFEYAGLVSGKTKCQFLRSLDAFIMPTYFEGLPMSLLECMSYGVTPVVTPVGSIPQVVEDGVNGLFVATHDSCSIVEVVKRLNGNRSLLRDLGNSARKTIFTQFCVQSYVEKLNDLYRSI